MYIVKKKYVTLYCGKCYWPGKRKISKLSHVVSIRMNFIVFLLNDLESFAWKPSHFSSIIGCKQTKVKL